MTVQSRGGLVYRVEPGSLAEYVGIMPGDLIVSVNDHVLRDEIDFRFYSAGENITLDVVKQNGKKQRFEIEKDTDDLMGISFDNPVFDSIKTCRNNCCFCFISQLPRGLRQGLYLRDDDYRLSFLFGNFISLTNLTCQDWKRIDEQRLTPLRVSLHTSNPGVRARLMGNPDAGRAMEYLEKFKQKGICAHIQIVLLKGVNDGDKLISTLEDLDSLGGTILSVGVVPAVYTKYREVPPSENGGSQWAGETLEIVEDYAERAYKQRGVHWVYGADEFYFVSGREFPGYEFYDDFPQFENGIGVVADFREATKAAQSRLAGRLVQHRRAPKAASQAIGGVTGTGGHKGKILAVTGHMAYPEVTGSVKALRLENRISVARIRNSFFGDTVTCAGLLTGRDILSDISNLKKAGERYESVLIPSCCVFEGKFLDDMAVSRMSEELGLPVKVVRPSPDSLLDAGFGPGGD